MGCDIHIYIEHKGLKSDEWQIFGRRFRPGRSYDIFSRMADVRNDENITPICRPRGLPDDISNYIRRENELFISSGENANREGFCSREKAEEWVSSGFTSYSDDGHDRILHPDWHSHSWLTPQEYEEVLNTKYSFIPNKEWFAILDILKYFEKQGDSARIVFWFDS